MSCQLRSFTYVSCLLLLLLFVFSSPVHAVTVSILNAPSTIDQNDFTLTASVSGAQAGTNYLRVDLYKDGTTNYFGETNNGNSWVSGSDGTTYFPIITQANTPWVGIIEGRIGNPSAGEYDGTGNYRLRLRRYTASGNSGSSDTLDSVPVTILFPTPTLPPTNTPIPLHTPTPTPTPKMPTATTIPKTPQTSSSSQQDTDTATEGFVASEESNPLFAVTITPQPSPTTDVLGISEDKNTFPWVPVLCISMGVLLFGACGILMYLHYKKYGTFFPNG